MIHSCIGTDEAVACFGDQYRITANDAPRLLQYDFNGPRIFFQPRGDSEGMRRRLHACELNEGTFRL